MPAFMRLRAGCYETGWREKQKTSRLRASLLPEDLQRAFSEKLTVSPTGGEVMTSRTWSRTPITFALALAILCTYSMVALASPQTGQGPTGDLSVVGEVSVNGTSAISGAKIGRAS